MKAIIAIYSLIKDSQIEELRQIAQDYDVLLASELEEEDFPRIEIIFGWKAILTEKYNAGQLSNLRWIQKETAGLDAIPEYIRKDQKILISNMKGIHAVPITENVFAYIFGIARGIFKSIEEQKNHHWDKSIKDDLFSVKNKTIVIYGTGKIGQEIAKTAQFFKMKTIGINTDGRSINHFDECYGFDESYDKLKQAKYVVSSLPDIASTKNIFNMNFLQKMAKDSYFINIGRGATVNEEDLIHALKDKVIAGAYLDVTQIEPLKPESNLWDTANLIISPHISGTIEHFRDEIFVIYRQNLLSYLEEGKLIVNEFNRDKGY